MATGNQKINIIISAQDRATKEINKISSKLKTLQPTFKKMAVVGTIGFGALATGIGLSVKEAAKAEGSFNKFKTVFGENTEEMEKFIDALRKEMPSARTDIIRMAADLQDLLVPLGLTREKATGMSKGFLDVANKIAAFNDVEPTQVLEAIKSALAGSSEPLRQFGVNALESALEARALEAGLLGAEEKFKDLEPQIKTQIRAQALLAQIIENSSDAISGFEENNDSFIRRQQELSATIKEVSGTLGAIFLPMVDKVLKKALPVVVKIGEWIEKNPKLSATIVIIAGALAGLVAVVGTLGILLPGIITVFGLLLGPIGLVGAAIGLIIAAVVLLVTNWDVAKAALSIIWEELSIKFKRIWQGIKDFFLGIWIGIKEAFSSTIDFFRDKWETLKNIFKSATDWIMDKTIRPLVDAFNKVQDAVGFVGGKISGAGKAVGGFLGSIVPQFADGGVVPGPIGAPVPAIVHGGETIIPTGGKGGGNFNFNFAGAMIGDTEEFKRMIIQVTSNAMNRASELKSLGGA